MSKPETDKPSLASVAVKLVRASRENEQLHREKGHLTAQLVKAERRNEQLEELMGKDDPLSIPPGNEGPSFKFARVILAEVGAELTHEPGIENGYVHNGEASDEILGAYVVHLPARKNEQGSGILRPRESYRCYDLLEAITWGIKTSKPESLANSVWAEIITARFGANTRAERRGNLDPVRLLEHPDEAGCLKAMNWGKVMAAIGESASEFVASR